MSLKILIVDEDPTSIQLLRSLGAPMGHTVLAFTDGHAAIERAETQRFQLFFVGMRAGELDGPEMVRRIRSTPPNRESLIVMFNTSDSNEVLRKAFAEGADLVAKKPLVAARLRVMLTALDAMEGRGRDKRHAARLPLFTDVSCVCGERQFSLRTMNISESGVLLQGTMQAEAGQEVALQFKIADVDATLNAKGRIARKEGNDRFGVEFLGLAPEDKNAIQLYVMGRMMELTRERDLSSVGVRKPFHP
jgi:CheY-like chemotaxis protein